MELKVFKGVKFRLKRMRFLKKNISSVAHALGFYLRIEVVVSDVHELMKSVAPVHKFHEPRSGSW